MASTSNGGNPGSQKRTNHQPSKGTYGRYAAKAARLNSHSTTAHATPRYRGCRSSAEVRASAHRANGAASPASTNGDCVSISQRG